MRFVERTKSINLTTSYKSGMGAGRFHQVIDMDRVGKDRIVNMIETGLSTIIRVVRWRIFDGFDRHDVTGLGLVVEMQLDSASLKLLQHIFDARLDGRMVRAVASDELLDDGPKCRWRQSGVWDTHRISLRDQLRIRAPSYRIGSAKTRLTNDCGVTAAARSRKNALFRSRWNAFLPRRPPIPRVPATFMGVYNRGWLQAVSKSLED
jgi:hypothetical protein